MYGDRVHEAVVAAGETETGITIHYLNEHFDEGEIIVQYKCPVVAEDTAGDVAKKVHALEYEYYPKVIEQFVVGSVLITFRNIDFCGEKRHIIPDDSELCMLLSLFLKDSLPVTFQIIPDVF